MKRFAGLLVLGLLAGCGPDVAMELAAGKALLANAAQQPADALAAREHLQRAAEHGSAAAAFHLGLLHRRGAAGLKGDAVEARRWLRLSAEKGLADAQFMLGQMVAHGEGGPADVLQARQWFERAAEQEHPEANFELAMAYRRGDLGVQPDAAAADRYLMEAEHALKHPRTLP
ncbi:tetratricopeptide repeat protein [Piscinibacter terrae]|uniref:Sel1 repeat family protein n=1 Tax=Piscinibacter terrae TaxID=2496871 RepID=A0A3N7HVZ0_9BURK|nr:tetratricopeptide repeat protein [Albitalea terrae]RQP26494.1 sel1 repeat family protein [Albitalea terrae]